MITQSTVDSGVRVEMLRCVIDALEAQGVSLCILNGYDNLANEVPSDIDCMVQSDQLPLEFMNVINSTCLRVVGVFQRELNTYVVVVANMDSRNPEFIWFDAESDFREHGRVFFQADEVLASAIRQGKFFTPSVYHEFILYLVKKVVHGSIPEKHAGRLTQLFQVAPEQCRAEMETLWCDEAVTIMVQASLSGDWSAVNDSMKEIREELFRSVGAMDRRNAVRTRLAETGRRLRRFTYPTGVHVVFLGSDGSGKSTVIRKVECALAPGFRQTARLHLFPSSNREKSGPVIDPHGQPPRSLAGSIVKMGVWWVRYTCGYIRHIRAKLVRSVLVVSDRYFLDILVDPVRYRYGGPTWLPQLVWKFLPKPDLIILLDAPADVLQQRKQEVPFEESERQVLAYRDLFGDMNRGHIVNANQSVEDVVSDVNRIILNFMAARTHKRFKLDQR